MIGSIDPRLAKHRGQLLFLQRRGRRGRLYERGFLSNGPTEPLLPPKKNLAEKDPLECH